jgi:hypothetical protein
MDQRLVHLDSPAYHCKQPVGVSPVSEATPRAKLEGAIAKSCETLAMRRAESNALSAGTQSRVQ